ncbi:hypothetical protein AB9T88_02320 [Flavobacterium sp. LBUM151]
MKSSTILFLTISLLVFKLCYSQNIDKLTEYQNDNLIKEIGIGLVQQIDVNEEITLYDDINCKKTKIKNAKIGKDIIPLLNKTDYSIFFLFVLKKIANTIK